jgi:hypothetical protein
MFGGQSATSPKTPCGIVSNSPEKRGQIIKYLEQALALADEIGDADTGFLIERALDEVRSRQFRPAGRLE